MSSTVLVQNTKRGPTVFSIPPKNVAIEWKGHGDPNGEDVQYVTEDVLDTPEFMRAIQKGVLTVVEASDEVKAKIQRQAVAYHERLSRDRQEAEAVIDRQTETPITTVNIDEKGQVISSDLDGDRVIIEPRQRG